MAWEYKTLGIRIQQKTLLEKKLIGPKAVGYVEAVLDDDAEQELHELGEQGWELVSLIPIDSGGLLGSSAGTHAAIAFFKRST
jgi:hypothetical protein